MVNGHGETTVMARTGWRRNRRSRASRAWASMIVGPVLLCTVVAPTAFADSDAPTEPWTLTASNVTSSSVSLSWGGSRDAQGIEGYRVYRGAASGTSMSLITTTD